ncbi:MAG: four helix bundle protein [Alistipes sp.]|nr:four helix bundle protein [Alistipes sp.]
MAIYDNLPVFKQSYDLLLQILKLSSNLQRDFRYTVGETLKKDLLGLCVCIYRANGSAGKIPHIGEARERMVSIKLLMRVLHDTKQISTKQFALACEKMESISKQLAAWQKYVKDKDRDLADGNPG